MANLRQNLCTPHAICVRFYVSDFLMECSLQFSDSVVSSVSPVFEKCYETYKFLANKPDLLPFVAESFKMHELFLTVLPHFHKMGPQWMLVNFYYVLFTLFLSSFHLFSSPDFFEITETEYCSRLKQVHAVIEGNHRNNVPK